MVIISIDPGVTTGIAIRYDDDRIGTHVITKDRQVRELRNLMELITPDVCVFEEFSAQQIDTNGLHTVRLIGAIEVLCLLRGCTCVLQFPWERNGQLQAARAWHKGKKHMVHQVDALAHLLLYEDRVASGKVMKDRRSL